MAETFRLATIHKYLGMGFCALFLAAVIGSWSSLFLEEPEKHGFKGELSVIGLGCMGTAVFGSMFLMSAYMWASYYLGRFTVDGTIISLRTPLQNRRFDVSEIQQLDWKCPRNGHAAVVFRLPRYKTRLDFGGFKSADSLRIVRLLRERVPEGVQHGWPLFCHGVALPLRDGPAYVFRGVPAAALYFVTRRRYDRAFAFCFPAAILAAVGIVVWVQQWKFMVVPIPIVGAWLLLRFSIPPEGMQMERRVPMKGDRPVMICLGVLFLSLVFMIGALRLGVNQVVVFGITGVAIAATTPWMLYWTLKDAKERKKANEQAENEGAESAPAIWLQGEASAGD